MGCKQHRECWRRSIQPSFLGGLLFLNKKKKNVEIWIQPSWCFTDVKEVTVVDKSDLNSLGSAVLYVVWLLSLQNVWMPEMVEWSLAAPISKSDGHVFWSALSKGMNSRYWVPSSICGNETEIICLAQPQLAPTLWCMWTCSPSHKVAASTKERERADCLKTEKGTGPCRYTEITTLQLLIQPQSEYIQFCESASSQGKTMGMKALAQQMQDTCFLFSKTILFFICSLRQTQESRRVLTLFKFLVCSA